MGSTLSILRNMWDQSLPPKSHFSVDDIPDLTGKVIIVTGGNAGVGKETCKALLTHNAKVYLAARSEEKAQAAIAEIEKETGKTAIWLKLDLAELKAVKKSAEEFLSKETELHVLFNNGGVMAPPIDSLTADGYDLQFGTNVLGHFYFTKLLMPALQRGAQSSPDGKARVVNTSSSASMMYTADFNTFKDGPARRKLGTERLYFQSKFGNVVFSNELQRRFGHQNIVSTSLNPGNLETELQRHMGSIQARILKLMLYPAAMGALTQLWAGTSPETVNMGGKYLIPWARLGETRKEAYDEKIGKDLWQWLEEQTANV